MGRRGRWQPTGLYAGQFAGRDPQSRRHEQLCKKLVAKFGSQIYVAERVAQDCRSCHSGVDLAFVDKLADRR